MRIFQILLCVLAAIGPIHAIDHNNGIAATSQTDETTTLSGFITDVDGEPLPGAVVRVEGTSYACSANVDGKYVLRARLQKGSLIKVTYIGMEPLEVIYDFQPKLDFTLAPAGNKLDEVVVTAEPNINNIDIRARSGVVQTVDMKRLNEKPMTDISLALQGAVPGLIVTNTGELGSKPAK